MPAKNYAPYQLASVQRACNVLRTFRDEEEFLTLAEIAARCGLEKTIAFRLLHTLESEGFLRKIDARHYATNLRLFANKRFRIGFATQTADSPFSRAVEDSVQRAAAKHQVDILILNNNYGAKEAVRNAQKFIQERVDLAIEFQTHQKTAALISSLFRAAEIPLVAVEIPHPGAVFYGTDNYRAGLAAGQTLARWVKQHWRGRADELLLLELEAAGSLPRLRLSGAETALREALPSLRSVHPIDTRGEFLRAFEAVRKRLRFAPQARTLIVGINDPSTLGALRAFEEAGRAGFCAAVGHSAIPEARAELRRPGTRLVASIAFFPEHFGEDLVLLALDLLHKRNVPSAVFARHQLLTPQNVDRFYPNDTASTIPYEELR
jgi:ribose transport system substrate-binding protein